jgi:hypothetical protein
MGDPELIMGSMSAWHLVSFALLAAAVLYPIGRILARMGFSPLWSIVALIPLANLLGVWAVALAPWANDKGQRD